MTASHAAGPSRRQALALGAGVTAAGLGWGLTREATAAHAASPQAGAVAGNVHIFYYPWYGSPKVNGSYRHWQQNGHTPPDDVASDFYPVQGAYDSGDAAVLAQHMAWIRGAGIGTVVTSWWGQGSYEDKLVPKILDAAQAQGLKVAWHIEPYGYTSASQVVSDINYINSTYGSHAAFYRDGAHGNRPAFYMFNSLKTADWSALNQVNAKNITLTQTTDVSKVADFGGMYNYAFGADPGGWAACGNFCRANGKVWAPSVGPGYIARRATGQTAQTPRDNGQMYDTTWTNALASASGGPPSWVSITSFNEWHEGTLIEPATSTPPGGVGYQTFSGAYGRTGTAAQTAYLDRTAYWVNKYTGVTPSSLGRADARTR
jgi:glycoprotein endo-alpha-1,2-mannosidase